jgi:hypothetical protein
MNNQVTSNLENTEIYNGYHINLIQGEYRGRTYYTVIQQTPQSVTLKQKYPSWCKGYSDHSASFHNLEQAEAHIAELKSKIDAKIARRQAKLQEKAKAREEFVNPYKLGDILYSCWGYEQTNREFYQVVAVGNRSLKLRQIACESVRATGPFSDQVAPLKDKFVSEKIYRVNIVIHVWGDKVGHSVKSPTHGSLSIHEGGSHSRSWGH